MRWHGKRRKSKSPPSAGGPDRLTRLRSGSSARASPRTCSRSAARTASGTGTCARTRRSSSDSNSAKARLITDRTTIDQVIGEFSSKYGASDVKQLLPGRRRGGGGAGLLTVGLAEATDRWPRSTRPWRGSSAGPGRSATQRDPDGPFGGPGPGDHVPAALRPRRDRHPRAAAGLGRGPFTPEALLALSDEQLRAAGLSHAKMAALRDLAAKVLDGTVVLAAGRAAAGRRDHRTADHACAASARGRPRCT